MSNVQNGAPTWLAPDFRYSGDDWTDDNALTYIVYEVAPVYAADGVTVTTPGTPRDLTNYTVSGTLRYRCALTRMEPPAPPLVVTMTGTIIGNPTAGTIALSLPKAQTIFPRQSLDLLAGFTLDPKRSLLIVQPKVIGADAAEVTVGLQPLYVF